MSEAIEKRSLNSKHFLNENGSFTAQIHATPIHHIDWTTGELLDNDYTIVPEINWEFEYAVKKNNFRAYFNDSTDIKNATLASFEILNSQGVVRWINYKLFGADPTGHLYKENRFKYYNVFPNVDLEYIVSSERLKENIIVKESTANFSYTFTLKMSEGLKLEQQPDGSIFFIDTDTGEELWEISRPYAEDSSPEVIRTEAVAYTLGKQIYEGIEYDSITVDLLEDISKLTFPIVIDPTVTIISNTSNWMDTRVFSGDPDYTGSGDDNILYLGFNSTLAESRILFQPDLSSIPSNAKIISAVASHYLTIDNGGSITVRTYSIEEPWSDNFGVTSWNTMPSVRSYLGSLSNVNSGGYYDFPLTTYSDDFQKIISGELPNYGFYLMSITVTASTHKAFYSSEHTSSGSRPTLTVEYNVPPSAPVITSPISGVSIDSTHTITWNLSTDAETAQGSLQYNADLSIDDGLTYPYEIVALTAAGETSYEYDFSAIPESAICKIRLRAFDGASFGGYGYSDTFEISHGKGYVKVNGEYVKVKIFVKGSGVYVEAKAYRKVNGVYEKM
ncbi:MAG: hypothetical protein APF84_05860 [Gracilibacter sp. BRH_c7a]|nr:MAG: hypothetical protein APF84_05860 [Gracilibacter sp. BRH_c7a]